MAEFSEIAKLFDTGSVVKHIDHPLLRELQSKNLQRVLRFTDQAIVIMNHTTLEYVYLTENIEAIFGYTISEWKEQGMAGMLARIHPADADTFTKVVFPEYFKVLDILDDADKLKSRFTYTYRMKNKDGRYVQVVQQNIILSLENGRVGLGLLILSDQTAFKKNDNVYYNIVLVRHPETHEVLLDNTLAGSILSQRELEVLRLMSKGLGEKEIAEKLKLSVNTVKTHKRRMISKTGVRNGAELVRYGSANFLT